MYPAVIMQQPIITITLIIIFMLLNPYLDGIPARTAGLTPPAPNLAFEARPVSDINYRAIGAAAGRTLATFCIFHSTPSFPLNCQFNRLIRFFRTPCRGCFNRNFMRPRFSKTQKSFHFLNPMMRKVICDIFRVWMFAPKTRSAIFGPPPILAKFAFTALYISFLHSDTSIKSSLYLAF